MSSGSVHKINRNNHYRIELSGTSFVTSTVRDNGFIARVLPFYKESINWFKKYLPSNLFIDYVLYTATYSGSSLSISQQSVTIESSPSFYEYRLDPTSSIYNSLNSKQYQELRLGDRAKIKNDRKEMQIYFESKPLIYDSISYGGRYYTSTREPPIDYASEIIKYNIDNLIDGHTSVFESDFAHEELNRVYNVQNRKKKYEKLTSIFEFEKNVKLKHKQTVYPDQNDIWNRVRPYFTYSSWVQNQHLRERDASYEYEYARDDLNYEVDAHLRYSSDGLNCILVSGSNMYIGGDFDYIVNASGNNSRTNFAVLDKESLQIGGNATVTNNDVLCMTISGSNLYLGGLFSSVSGTTRNKIAVIDKDTGILGPFNPSITGAGGTGVYCMLISGSNLYVGGDFTTVSGTTRNCLGVVDKDSGALGPFNPNITGTYFGVFNPTVYSIQIDGNNLYIGGNFASVSGSSRYDLAAVDKDSGALDSGFVGGSISLLGIRKILIDSNYIWAAGVGVYQYLEDSTLGYGGYYTSTVLGFKLDKSTGNLSENFSYDRIWHRKPNYSPSISIYDIILSGSILYFAGSFDEGDDGPFFLGELKRHIFAYNSQTREFVDWSLTDEQIEDINSISAMYLDGTDLYLGAEYTTNIDGKYRSFIKFDTNTNQQLEFYYSTSDMTSSIWPLDFWQESSGSYPRGEYINYSTAATRQYSKKFDWTFYPIVQFFIKNNADAKKSFWTVPEETNSYPFFNNENEFLGSIKSKYKDYSSVPEYLVSNFIVDNSLNTGSYDIYASGTIISDNLFTNFNSDIKNIFNVKKDINKDIVEVELKLNYVNLFRPYRNLYPVEKTLQASQILYSVMETGETTGTVSGLAVTVETGSWIKNFLLEPFLSPGVLLNSLKAGISLTWPYYTGTDYGMRYTASLEIPFEGIYNPLKYMNNLRMTSYFQNIHTAFFTGTSFDQKYTDCITNFIQEIPNFFLDTAEDLVYFSSKPEDSFDTFLADNTYAMIISLDNYFQTGSVYGNAASSIAASPNAFGYFFYRDSGQYSLHVPPYFGYYLEGSSPSAPTYNKLKIVFTPATSGKYTLPEIISQSVVTKELTDERWNGNIHTGNIKLYGQNLLKSFNIFEFEKYGETDRVWNISGKFECPVFDFRSAISKTTSSTYPITSRNVGYGHQYGKKIGNGSSLSLNISDVAGSLSLADAVGFRKKSYEPGKSKAKERSHQLGRIKEISEVTELICIVPIDTVTNRFISIDKDSSNYKSYVNVFDYYMFPIKYDYKYGTAEPYFMYCFQTKMTLSYEDLSRIWQNVMPTTSFNHEEGSVIIRDNIVNNPMINEIFDENISWMIFKVKQRSTSNENGKHSFNWPYENFSITELAKLEVDLVYDDIRNIKNDLDPSIIGQKQKKQPRNIEIVQKGETIYPEKGNKEKRKEYIKEDDYGPELEQAEVQPDNRKFPSKGVDDNLVEEPYVQAEVQPAPSKKISEFKRINRAGMESTEVSNVTADEYY